MVYKALQYAEHMDVVEPLEIKEEVAEIMERALKRSSINHTAGSKE